jgi:glycosyltransferase involved in cell wall biosynthesis
MEKLAITRSQVLYAPCMDLVRRCQALFGAPLPPVRIFGYPLDLEQFAPPVALRHPGPLRILFLGRLEQRKGIETIVEAFPRLALRHPDVTLTILGSDTPNIAGYASARDYMEDRLRAAGCLEKVSFVSQVLLVDLPAMFHRHDIVWVPSLYDNYPLAALEAMACANVVVAAASGGLPEMIEDGVTGLLFPAGDAEALAERTATLCADAALRNTLGQAARRRLVTACSPQSLYEHTMELYRVALMAARKGDQAL